MNTDIYIVGAGTYGEAMYELADILGYKILGFYDEDDDKQNKLVMNTKVIGKFSNLKEAEVTGKNFIVAIGNNKIRESIMSRINNLGGITPTLIHPNATISPSSEIGNGVYVQANAYIWTKVKIGDFCIISPNVVICHHSNLGKACLISNVSGIGASISIGDRVFVGMGATVATGVQEICDDTIVGAGAVVIDSIYQGGVYVGVPARRISS
jgi:sugar O-acyltransferase (sialic acid O-acetyltransferase NeuD family)